MDQNNTLLYRLEQLLRHKKSKKYYAERLQISEMEVDELMKELKLKEQEDEETLCQKYEKTIKVNNEKGTIESQIVIDFEPKDDLELAKLHKIDLDKYIITNYWSKLLPNGKFTSSVFCKKRAPKDYTAEDFSKFLEKYKPTTIKIEKLENKNKEHVDIELSISDFHLAKKYVDGDNDPSKRAKKYIETANALVQKVSSIYNIDTIVLPISNDFFHTDNYQNSTTNGTPQDVILDYASEYELGFDVLVKTINILRMHSSNVIVVLVQGNHDRTKSFYLAHALDVFFKEAYDVSFIREHSVVKGLTLGSTFIGWHHGNCKIEDLPLLFATHPQYSLEFGKALYREVHTGDKHHYMTKEVKGVRIQQMPSLSGTDRWHLDNNYVHSIRAALALVYHPEHGKICELEERI